MLECLVQFRPQRLELEDIHGEQRAAVAAVALNQWFQTMVLPSWVHIQVNIQNVHGHHGRRRILSQAHLGLLLFSNAAILCQLLWMPRSDSSVND